MLLLYAKHVRTSYIHSLSSLELMKKSVKETVLIPSYCSNKIIRNMNKGAPDSLVWEKVEVKIFHF